jgi:hypothetical protein
MGSVLQFFSEPLPKVPAVGLVFPLLLLPLLLLLFPPPLLLEQAVRASAIAATPASSALPLWTLTGK